MQEGASRDSWRRRRGAVGILLLTLVYLCLELPFSVDLLNGVGGVASMPELQRLEVTGRLISGLAVALLLWQFLVLSIARRRGWRWFRTVMVGLIVAIATMWGVYVAEDALVDHVAAQGGGEARQTALATVLLAQAVKSDQVHIRGLPLSDTGDYRPDAKAFMALLPLMTARMKDLRARLMPVAETIVRNRLVAESGGSERFYQNTYVTPLTPVRAKYQHYLRGVRTYKRGYERYQAALSQLRNIGAVAAKEGDQAYWDYRRQLERKIHSKGPAPAWKCPAIRRQVKRKYGIDIPHDWNCWARAPFAAAVAARVRAQADKKLQTARRRLEANQPPRGITSFDAFVRQPAISKKLREGWRKHLGFDVPRSAVAGKHTSTSWNKLVYQPWLDAHAAAIVHHLAENVHDFELGGSFYDAGLRARKMLLIPAIALLFSLVGAWTHIIKLVVELSVIAYPCPILHFRPASDDQPARRIIDQRALLLRVGVLFAGLVMLALPLLAATPITRSPVFSSMEQSMGTTLTGADDSAGAVEACFARWAIQTEALVYPFNNELKHIVQPVYDFPSSWLVALLVKYSAPLRSPLAVG